MHSRRTSIHGNSLLHLFKQILINNGRDPVFNHDKQTPIKGISFIGDSFIQYRTIKDFINFVFLALHCNSA